MRNFPQLGPLGGNEELLAHEAHRVENCHRCYQSLNKRGVLDGQLETGRAVPHWQWYWRQCSVQLWTGAHESSGKAVSEHQLARPEQALTAKVQEAAPGSTSS